MSESTFSPRNIGIYAERIAEYHLKVKGHRIIAKNLRLLSGEIDLLTLKNKVICIIEVKSRGHQLNDEGLECKKDIDFIAEDNFSKTKLNRLSRLRRELECYLEDGHLREYVAPDANIYIQGVVVNIYYDKSKYTVLRLKLKHFLIS